MPLCFLSQLLICWSELLFLCLHLFHCQKFDYWLTLQLRLTTWLQSLLFPFLLQFLNPHKSCSSKVMSQPRKLKGYCSPTYQWLHHEAHQVQSRFAPLQILPPALHDFLNKIQLQPCDLVLMALLLSYLLQLSGLSISLHLRQMRRCLCPQYSQRLCKMLFLHPLRFPL